MRKIIQCDFSHATLSLRLKVRRLLKGLGYQSEKSLIMEIIMSEELLVKHCAPTLAGMKTGNLFTCSFDGACEMKECVRCWNRILTKKGLRVLPLRFKNDRALIYVYRPKMLSADLKHDIAEELLKERGYFPGDLEGCVLHLIKRLGEYEEFPHEIGLFLGYPPEDVHGFIENRPGSCKCVGCWKVYKDVDTAIKTFEKYKKCTDVYCSQFAKGRSIERLAVAG